MNGEKPNNLVSRFKHSATACEEPAQAVYYQDDNEDQMFASVGDIAATTCLILTLFSPRAWIKRALCFDRSGQHRTSSLSELQANSSLVSALRLFVPMAPRILSLLVLLSVWLVSFLPSLKTPGFAVSFSL